jgi:uncharacterized protein
LKIDRILKWFFPREDRFFDLFDRGADALTRACKELSRLEGVTRYDEVPDLAEKIHAIEHEGDEIIHEIITQLHSTFVTPIERPDITALATAIDDVLDLIDDAARRLLLYKIAPVPKGFAEMSHLIREAGDHLKQGVALIQNLSQVERIREISKKIHEVEGKGDSAYYRCLEQIYADEKDPIRIMQLKELLEDLEAALDKCEDVANILEHIVLQNG